MNPAVTNIGLMLLMNQFAKRLDLENNDTIFYIRVAFVAMNLITYLIYQYTRMQIIKRNDLTTLKYKEQKSAFQSMADPNAAGAADDMHITTHRDYDLSQVDTAIKGMYSSLAMMGFMHLYMKYTQPLLMQSVSPVKGALESPVVKIHLFGKAASGALKRPFTAPSFFGGAPKEEEVPAKVEAKKEK
ncbi:hypothetical protein ACO0QE_003283 [Hanseniaspora vineae]